MLKKKKIQNKQPNDINQGTRINLTKEMILTIKITKHWWNKLHIHSHRKDISHSFIRRILNVYITQSDLQIQCHSHQNTNDILHRSRKNNPKIHMKAQKTPNSPNVLKQKRTKLEAGNFRFRF